MRYWLILVFVLFNARAIAAVVATPEVRVITPQMSSSSITGIVGSVPGYVLKYFVPGTYIIPTNTTSWMKPGVTNLFHFAEGAFVYHGHPSDDSGGAATPRGLFDDVAGAGTLIVSGAGTFISSNKWGTLVHVQQANSKVEFSANNCIRANTNTGAAVFFQEEGDLRVNVLRDVENYGYDGYWNNSGNGTVFFRAGRIYVGDTAIEYTGGDAAVPHYFDIGTIEKRNMVHDRSIFMQIGDNVFIKAGVVNLRSNAYVQFAGSGFYLGCLEAHTITCDQNSNRSPLFSPSGNYRVRGAYIQGPDTLDATFLGPGTVLENCTIAMGFGSGTGTNAISSNPGDAITVVGGLNLLYGGVGAGTVINGGPVNRVHTNSYSGTNVFIALDAYDKQVLIATNSMRLLWTNQSTLASGKEISLTIYNNKSTNMNITHSAGVRFMGGASNTVNAGKELAVAIKKIGTNISLSFAPQTN